MFEGKNIHFSQTDQKPLCSFSGKVCNQRRLNNYGFCVRHILEDCSAPFKRCAYVAKSSRQTCTQPIPKTEQRHYCNNHMQVLGMLPKKERKPKLSKSAQITCGHVGAMSDPGLLQNKLKLSQNSESDMVLKSSMAGHRITAGNEDMDDIYAFPADSEKSTREFTALLNNPSVSIVGPGNISYGASVKSINDSSSGTSSLAKIYPELAEKLEKIKPKIDTAKVKGKGKISRTINSLQNKIAQNKIKDKLKRTQSSSNTSSQSQSPSHSFMSSSPGYHVNTSSPNHVVQHLPTHNERLLTLESPVSHDGRNSSQMLHSTKNQTSSSSALPSLSNFNILNGLNLQSLNLSLEQLGLPVPSVSDIEQTLKQLAKAANISLEGTTQTDEKASQSFKQTVGTEFIQPIVPPASLPNFPHLSLPPPPYTGVHHKPSTIVMHTASATLTNSPVKADPAIGVQAVPTASGNFSTAPVPLVTRQLFSSVPQSVSMSVPLPSVTSSALSSLPTLSSLTSAFSFASSMHPKLTLLTTSQPSSSVMSTSNQLIVTKSRDTVKSTIQSLPTSPAKPRPVKAKTKSGNASVASAVAVKRSVPMLTTSMLMVKPRKIRKVLDEHEKKMMKKNARDLYERSIKRSIDHHHMIYSGVVSSDDSDVSDCDMLPWQFDWLTPSSDEEPVDDEDNDYTLRTAKLAIGRARRRRQCFQARHSMRQDLREDDVMCLVKAARESVRSSVFCLKELAGKHKKSVERHTRTSLLKRRCLYRDSDDVQCKHVVVPYANHCNRHVMYNVDQQLFEYCTAKFADNTQCCRPVIDVKHELPLCIEHGRKADNFLKSQDLEPKPKKPRKKTKPSALTRPPKKGKKKKNQRKIPQVQEMVQLSEDAADTDVLESSEENMSQHENDYRPESNHRHQQDSPPLPQATTVAPTTVHTQSSGVVNTTQSFLGLGATASLVVSDSMKKVKVPEIASAIAGQAVSQEVKTGQLKTHPSAYGQLEELDQLAGLELDNVNVRMFGELDTASKLLEMNDFQDVFNKLPDEAFDIFSSKAGGLTSSDDLQAFEDSLALANRELNAGKESHGLLPPSSNHLQSTRNGGRRAVTAAILEDDLTRQIAEEVLQQNLGPDIGSHLGDSMCNGDAEESIKAIARSLSNTGMMLAAEAKQKSQDHDMFGSHSYGVNQYGRSSSLPSYNTLEYFPPNVSIQNLTMSSSSNVIIGNASLTSGVNVSKATSPQVFPGHTQVSVIPQNVTVTPQGIITTHIPIVSDINMANRKPSLAPFSQTVTIGNATVTGNQSSGTITLPGSQQLTAQQLSALVQQAAAHLPPLPPYKPRQQTLSNTSTQQQLTQIAIRPVMVTSSATSIVIPVGAMKTVPITFTAVSSSGQSVPIKHSSQDNLIQHLTRQQEQLGQQQQLLAQQILQQRISALNCGPLRVTLPSSQNLGFSTILQQGHIGQLGTMSASLVQAVPMAGQVTRHSGTSTSQSGSSHTSVPSTNILWTSPPNVTITTPNGVPRPAPQQKISSSSNMKMANLLPSTGTSRKETFIDLTDSDPPSYEATQVVLGKTQPPPSYPVPSPVVTSDTAMS